MRGGRLSLAYILVAILLAPMSSAAEMTEAVVNGKRVIIGKIAGTCKIEDAGLEKKSIDKAYDLFSNAKIRPISIYIPCGDGQEFKYVGLFVWYCISSNDACSTTTKDIGDELSVDAISDMKRSFLGEINRVASEQLTGKSYIIDGPYIETTDNYAVLDARIHQNVGDNSDGLCIISGVIKVSNVIMAPFYIAKCDRNGEIALVRAMTNLLEDTNRHQKINDSVTGFDASNSQISIVFSWILSAAWNIIYYVVIYPIKWMFSYFLGSAIIVVSLFALAAALMGINRLFHKLKDLIFRRNRS